MKKTSLALLLSLSALTASAQTKFYISGWGGIGKSGREGGQYSADGGNIKAQPKSGYNGGIAVGAQVKRWRVEVGFQYSTTGYSCSGLPTYNTVPDLSAWSVIYTHLSIPVRVGYVGNVTQRLRVIPSAGLMTSYNTGSNTKDKIPDAYRSVADFARQRFDDEYGSLSLWGTLGVNFEYGISDRISVFAGPAFQFMLTGADHPHSMNVNLGVNVKL